MELSSPLRARIWPSEDWSARALELEAEVQKVVDPWERSFRTYELAELCECLVPDRDRALVLYQRAWRLTGNNRRALIRARRLYDELHRLDMVATLAEVEAKHTREKETSEIIGNAWLDAGRPDRAQKWLAAALDRDPDRPDLRAALDVAKTSDDRRVAELERVRAAAAAASDWAAAPLCLHAARLARDINPGLYVDMLRRTLESDPLQSSANRLLAVFLESARDWQEYADHHRRQARSAESPRDAVNALRRGGLALAVRFAQPALGIELIDEALTHAYDHALQDVPGHPAMLTLMADTDSRRQLARTVDHCARALGAPLSEDDRLFVAVLAARIALRSLGNAAAAQRFLAIVHALVPDHSLIAAPAGGSR